MPNPETPFQDIRSALSNGEVGLRGPMKRYQDEIDFIQNFAHDHITAEWEQTNAAVNAMVEFAGVSTQDSEPDDLPPHFYESFERLAGHFVVAFARMNGGVDVRCEVADVKRDLPRLFEEFTAINGILGLTKNEFTRTRHPALGLSPEEAQSLSDRAQAVGFTKSHIKKFAASLNPNDALKNAMLSVLAIKFAGINLKPGDIRDIAASHRNPLKAAQLFSQTITELLEEYEFDSVVTRSDIEHFVRNYTVDAAPQEVADYVERVSQYTNKYAGDPVIDINTIRAVCRRLKDPTRLFDQILARHSDLCETYPTLSPHLTAYLARNYRDPKLALSNALTSLGADVDSADVLASVKTNDIWDILQGKK